MKLSKILLAWTLTICLLIAPFSGSIVLAFNSFSAPSITSNIRSMDYVTPDTVIRIEYTAKAGASLTACDTRLEGVSISTDSVVEFTPADHNLTNGVYTLVAQAVDSNGETAISTRIFTVTDVININFGYNENEDIVPDVPNATASIHKVTPLSYSLQYGSTSDGTVDPNAGNLDADDASVFGLQYMNESFDVDSVSGIPYQIFTVDLNGKTEGDIAVRYTGSTIAAERIALKVYNPATEEWDYLGTFNGSDSVSAAVDVAVYGADDAVRVMAILDYAINGSDTMIWSTDPQHYTKFEDLNSYYYQVYQYAAEQYKNGNAGYIITTGDLVDDRPNASVAAAQWQVADTAMDYVDEVGMPNGLVSGNHDVGDFKKPDFSSTAPTSDYSKFWETFPASRYNTKQWFGASLNNNASHYDLITIGNVDFIVMYLGYGVEATDETIVWANDVLERYSHRTAIVSTHEYLDAGAAVRPSNSRAQLIFDKIVDPNPNVKMVLCGHDDGSLCLEKTASDGRTVYEVLCDYQFVEAEDPDFYENEHYIGSVPHCCGDGYIRLMTVKGSTLSSITYSPVTDRYNPYGDRENLSIDLDIQQSARNICAVSFSAYVVGEEVENTYSSDTAIVINNDDQTVYHHISYYNWPSQPQAGANTPVDLPALQGLINDAAAIDTTPYTEDTAAALTTALEAAQTADTTDAYSIQAAYTDLANAIGALKIQKETIDPSTLSSMHKVDFTLSQWLNNDTSVYLTNSRSHITPTQTAAGGIHMTRSAASTNTWPSAKYRAKNIVMKPVNGKIYLNLDIDSDSAWCIYAEVTQGSMTTTVRFNFAIENAFNNKESDGFEGVFKGVYDVTEAFTENGLDPNATFTLNTLLLYIVPGDVTYDYIEFMTDISDGTLDTTAINAVLAEIAGMNEADYTPSTWSALEAEVKSANKVINNAASAQADINLATNNLKKALGKLKKVADIIPEPENSLLPADEGEWMPDKVGVMNIYRNEDNYTVFENTNSQWPNATYTFTDHPFEVNVADKQLTIEIDVTSESSVLIMMDKAWVNINKLITTNVSSANDIKSGKYTVGIPLSSIPELEGKETVSIKGVRIFSVGEAKSSAVIVKKLMLDDYIAPPPVFDTTTPLLPADANDTQSPSETGSHYTLPNGSLVVNSPEEGYRVLVKPENPVLFDLNTLNAIHMYIRSNIPFKVAFHLVNANNPNNSAWLTTSGAMYADLFTVTNDRVAPGTYDVFMEAKKHCSGLTDRSKVYMESITIVTDGVGMLTLNQVEMIAHSAVVMDESETYGPPATPENPYYEHCSINPPKVENKVNLLNRIGLNDQYVVTGWQTYGNQGDAAKALNISIDLAKTPYLYYSVSLPADSNFTFAFYNNSTNAPWLFFRDITGEGCWMNQGAGNWDAYKNREQYVTRSETGCIDLRDYRKNATNNSWIVNQVNFYNSTGKNVVLNYMFFGSEPLPVVKGDINGDNTFDVSDTFAVYSIACGEQALSTANVDKEAADVNKDGVIDMVDAMLLYRIVSGEDTWPEE